MKLKSKWHKLLLGAGCLTLIAPIAAACSSNSKLVFSNYDGYIDQDVANELANEHKENGLTYNSHDNNEVIPGLIKLKTVDVAVVSAYTVVGLAKNKLIQKIDWSQFNIINPETKKKITTVDELASIYTKEVWAFSSVYDHLLGDIDQDGKPDRLIEYMVPYFFQDFIFAYRGKKIDHLHNPNTTWENIYQELTRKGADNRFLKENEAQIGTADKPHTIKANKSKITLIDDSRTVYDLAKIMDHEGKKRDQVIAEANKQIKELQDEIQITKELIKTPNLSEDIVQQNKERLANLEARLNFYKLNLKPNVSLPKNSTVTEIVDKFNNITNHFKDLPADSHNLKASSNDLINELATGQFAAGLSYNGDISFALNGGEYLSDDASSEYENIRPNADNFHFIRPKNTLKVLDGFVISNFIDPVNIDATYKYINDISFSGLNLPDYDGSPAILRWDMKIHRNKTDKEIQDYENSDINQTEEGELLNDMGYIYKSMRNFDYVAYTPVLRSIYDHLLDADEGYYGANSFQEDEFKKRLVKAFLKNGQAKYTHKKERQTKHANLSTLAELVMHLHSKYKEENKPFSLTNEMLDDVYKKLTLVYELKNKQEGNEPVEIETVVDQNNETEIDLSSLEQDQEYVLTSVKNSDGTELALDAFNSIKSITKKENAENLTATLAANYDQIKEEDKIVNQIKTALANLGVNLDNKYKETIFKTLNEEVYKDIDQFIEQKQKLYALQREIMKVDFSADPNSNDPALIEFPTNDLSLANLKLAYIDFKKKA